MDIEKLHREGTSLVDDTMKMICLQALSLTTEYGVRAGMAFIISIQQAITELAERAINEVAYDKEGEHDCEECPKEIKDKCEAFAKRVMAV